MNSVSFFCCILLLATLVKEVEGFTGPIPGKRVVIAKESLRNYQRSVCAAAKHLDCRRVLGLVTRTEPMATDADQ
ncbi:hypothetical protein ACROYT_G001290 [Oculina patagonica]